MNSLGDLATNQFALLNAAIFGASLLQAATGIGFGIVAGPILLIVMNSGDAFQVSIILSFLIATLAGPGVRHHVNNRLLTKLVAGTIAGAPVGIVLFLALSIDALKLVAGFAVLFMIAATLGLLRFMGRPGMRSTSTQLGVGLVSGVMNASLAMPGPPVAAYLTSNDYPKEEIRATTLVLFLISYPIALTAQGIGAGISTGALWLSLTLVPATLLGVVAGGTLARRISPTIFRKLIIGVLILTALGLFYSAT